MTTWLLLMFIGWFAATVSGAAGFGGALILLPVLTYAVGAKAAVPILTIAQLLGNLSRAGFGFSEIRWRPVCLFSVGTIPLSILGARVFVALPAHILMCSIGLLLLLIVVFRHTRLGQRQLPDYLLSPAGAVVGLLSAIAGSAGPLGAAVFLGLSLPPTAYIASEAVTASLMHITKTVVYGRYAMIQSADVLAALALGGSMIMGSWSGRRLIQQLPQRKFSLLVEVLLIISGVLLILTCT